MRRGMISGRKLSSYDHVRLGVSSRYRYNGALLLHRAAWSVGWKMLSSLSCWPCRCDGKGSRCVVSSCGALLLNSRNKRIGALEGRIQVRLQRLDDSKSRRDAKVFTFRLASCLAPKSIPSEPTGVYPAHSCRSWYQWCLYWALLFSSALLCCWICCSLDHHRQCFIVFVFADFESCRRVNCSVEKRVVGTNLLYFFLSVPWENQHLFYITLRGLPGTVLQLKNLTYPSDKSYIVTKKT